MSKLRGFNKQDVLYKAMLYFWGHGYAATSLFDLIREMGIGRQCIYDAFDSKHKLYLLALQEYFVGLRRQLADRLSSRDMPLASIVHAIGSVAEESEEVRARGCMAANAAAEFGRNDAQVYALLAAGNLGCAAAFHRVLHEAKKLGELDPDFDVSAGGHYLLTAHNGLYLSARLGVEPSSLREMAKQAVMGLEGSPPSQVNDRSCDFEPCIKRVATTA